MILEAVFPSKLKSPGRSWRRSWRRLGGAWRDLGDVLVVLETSLKPLEAILGGLREAKRLRQRGFQDDVEGFGESTGRTWRVLASISKVSLVSSGRCVN